MYNPLLVKGVENFEKKIESYAKLLLHFGLRFQKGWALAIECPNISPDLARACAKEAYKSGARDVMMSWFDPYIAREKYLNSDISNLGKEFNWPDYARNKYKQDMAFLVIESYNTDFANDVPNDRRALYNKGTSEIFASFKRGLEYPYTICVGASREWAIKVFPDMEPDEAYIKLWNLLFDIVYVDGENDPIKIWEEKTKNWSQTQKKMMDFHFEKLHITSELGTDVEVKLPDKHFWLVSTINYTSKDLGFAANIPTEELFTDPLKHGVNGTVVASKPIISKSGPIFGAKFELKDGEIIKFSAEDGEDILASILDSDKNGRYLGEFSIVDFNSPISKSGLTFYCNLVDENSGCHMAIGNCYPKCLVGGTKMTTEELEAEGVNICSFHEDFVFGTAQTKIVGTTYDGEEILIYDKGAYCI